MAEDDFDPRKANATAHIAYALVCVLLNELEKGSPGLRKRVWKLAQHSLKEHDLLDEQSANWVTRKIADL